MLVCRYCGTLHLFKVFYNLNFLFIIFLLHLNETDCVGFTCSNCCEAILNSRLRSSFPKKGFWQSIAVAGHVNLTEAGLMLRTARSQETLKVIFLKWPSPCQKFHLGLTTGCLISLSLLWTCPDFRGRTHLYSLCWSCPMLVTVILAEFFHFKKCLFYLLGSARS